LVAAILALGFLSILPAKAFVGLVQEAKGTATSSTTVTCVYGSNVVSGNELVFGVSYNIPSTVHISGTPTDTRGTTYTRQGTTLTAGSNPLNSTVWTGVAGGSGADTITVTMSGSTGKEEIACKEFSGSTNTLVTAKTATGTATSGATYSLAVASFTPAVGDLVYAYGSGDPCGGSVPASVGYSTSFTSGTANTAAENVLSTCKTVGAVQFKLGQVDEYAVWPNSVATTAAISWVMNTAVSVNTGEWSEIVIELGATNLTTTVTTTVTTTTTTTVTSTVTSTVTVTTTVTVTSTVTTTETSTLQTSLPPNNNWLVLLIGSPLIASIIWLALKRR
jgi:hypothetical protein